MNKDLIDYKTSEYIGKMGVAFCRGDLESARKYAKTLLVLYRVRARDTVANLTQDTDELHSLKRERLVGYGESIVVTLDWWQGIGATLEDLCNLCNRDHKQVLREIKPERVDLEFSSLIFVYNLDYKDPRNRGWIDYDVDAPFTHAVKDYFLELMISTPEGRAASHRALEECFPGILEGALMEVTDADGVRRLIDKDGVEVATLDGENKQ